MSIKIESCFEERLIIKSRISLNTKQAEVILERVMTNEVYMLSGEWKLHLVMTS